MRCPHCDTPVLGSETVCMYCHRRLDYEQIRQAEDAAKAGSDHLLPRIRTKYSVEILISLVGLGVALLLMVVGLWLGWNPSFSVLLPIALGASLLLSLWLAAGLNTAARSAIQRMVTDKQTIHWTYSEAEWRQFTGQAWQRAIRSDVLVGGGLLGLMLVIGLIILGSAHGAPTATTAFAIWIGTAVGMGLLFCLKDMVIWLIRRRRGSSDAYISPSGIIVGGWYSPLPGLERVVYQPGDPAVIRFVTRSRSVAADGVRTTRRQEMEVPVPQGHELEAERLVEDLKRMGF